eukprot:GDKH01000150.1.p3 GENE.GDKH01000150.1~~GDKH01000150.1.p3  ORF type:complete len:61 (-),score=4.45 GDKH01000150.1:73-255(-)
MVQVWLYHGPREHVRHAQLQTAQHASVGAGEAVQTSCSTWANIAGDVLNRPAWPRRYGNA